MNEIIGKTEKQAKNILEEINKPYRVAVRNGQHFMLTCDFQPDRANLFIEDNVVKEMTFG